MVIQRTSLIFGAALEISEELIRAWREWPDIDDNFLSAWNHLFAPECGCSLLA